MALDVATATVWLRDHAAKYGGDPERIFLMGHSAGAHLVSTRGHERNPAGSGPRVRSRICAASSRWTRRCTTCPCRWEVAGGSQRQAFGEDPAVWRRRRPGTTSKAGKGIPPFLVFISDGRAQGPVKPIPFTNRLREAGVEASAHEIAGRGHGPLDFMIGTEGDETTGLILEFLGRYR